MVLNKKIISLMIVLIIPFLFILYVASAATVFDEQWTSVGTNTYNQDDLIANTDEGNWYCRASADNAFQTCDTVNGEVRVNNQQGVPSVEVSIEQTDAPLDSTVDEMIADMQMEAGGGSMHVTFENGGTDVCSIEVTTGNDVYDNQANFYSNVLTYTTRQDYEFNFDFSAYTFNFSVNGSSIFTGIAFDNNESAIDTVRITRETNQYIDVFSVQMNGDSEPVTNNCTIYTDTVITADLNCTDHNFTVTNSSHVTISNSNITAYKIRIINPSNVSFINGRLIKP